MGERSEYAPGTFSWTDLATTDQDAAGVPPHWLAYFGIDDIDAGLAKVTELGGTVHAGPIDVGIAKLGIVQDPQGAAFALYAGELER